MSGASPVAKCPQGAGELEILVTAQEAYPRLEALFLGAESEIEMGFRLFDPRTKLRSHEACAIGETWADLILHTINRGIPVHLTVSDFDPVMAHDMHEQAWQFMAIAAALNELAEPGAAKLSARCVLHPARGGIFPRLLFAVKTRKELKHVVDTLNGGRDPAGRLRHAPGLQNVLRIRNNKLEMRPDAVPHLHPVTLHHKMAVFDAQTTYMGGLDLNERRFDGPSHDQPAQGTWHDVQLVVHDTGVARSALRYLTSLPDVIDCKSLNTSVKSPFLTTMSVKRSRNWFHLSPINVNKGLLQAHVAQIERARTFVYLETQYFRDTEIVSALLRARAANPKLQIVVLLPAAPEDVAFDDRFGLDGRFGEYLQARALRRIRRGFGRDFLAVSPVQPRRPGSRDTRTARSTLKGAPIVYVHSKVSIFDARAAIVSSANLNGRSMKWDAEAGILIEDPTQVQALASRVYGHWLGEGTIHNHDNTFAMWHARALANAELPPAQRRGFIVPHDMKPAARIGVPIPGAPEEMV